MKDPESTAGRVLLRRHRPRCIRAGRMEGQRGSEDEGVQRWNLKRPHRGLQGDKKRRL